jgi:hypothetical protein
LFPRDEKVINDIVLASSKKYELSKEDFHFVQAYMAVKNLRRGIGTEAILDDFLDTYKKVKKCKKKKIVKMRRGTSIITVRTAKSGRKYTDE